MLTPTSRALNNRWKVRHSRQNEHGPSAQRSLLLAVEI